MRKRYFIRRSYDDAWDQDVEASASLARTVHEPDPTPYRTGILGPDGEPLWAVIELDPIGFIRRD